MLLWTDGKLKVVPSDRRASNDDDSDTNITVDLARVRQTVDPAAEWRQMYDETGRSCGTTSGAPDMSGVDWSGVLDRYRPVLDRVATHDDLVDLLWEVQGELGTSHAYVIPRGGHGAGARGRGCSARTSPGATTPTGRLWRIDRILPVRDLRPRRPLPARRARRRRARRATRSSPWAGVPVDPVDRARAAARRHGGQAGRADRSRRPAAASSRHAVVVPIADEEPLRYHAWVADRRAYVHEKSGGRLGYLHVPDMQAPGWAQIHRDLRVEVAREGLVVDVRENRGGHTSQLVVEKLARRIVGWDLPRGMRPYSYPRGRAARPGRRRRQRVLRLRRGHRQRGDQGAGDRPGGGHAHLGRRDRHRQPVPAGRRHAGDPAQVRVLAGGLRVGRGEPRASTRTWRWCRRPQDHAAGRDAAAGRGDPDGAGGPGGREPGEDARRALPTRKGRGAVPRWCGSRRVGATSHDAPAPGGRDACPIRCRRTAITPRGGRRMAGEPQADCLFCKIVAGEVPATVVRETETTVAFRDINPQAPDARPGHPQGALRGRRRARRRRSRELAADVLREAARSPPRTRSTRPATASSSTPAAAPGRPSSTRTPMSLGGRGLQWPPG